MINFWMRRTGTDDYPFVTSGCIYEYIMDIDPRIELDSTKIINMILLIEGFKI